MIIFTIGYGGRKMDAFIDALREHGVTHVADVRSFPKSKHQPEYNRVDLEERLSCAGIRYVFMGDTLGGRPQDPGLYDDGQVVYDRVRASSNFAQGIQVLLKALSSDRVLCLMCSEAKPESCHRSKLIGSVLDESGVELRHIDEQGRIKTQEQVLSAVIGGQPDLFDEGLRSRKRYGGQA